MQSFVRARREMERSDKICREIGYCAWTTRRRQRRRRGQKLLKETQLAESVNGREGEQESYVWHARVHKALQRTMGQTPTRVLQLCAACHTSPARTMLRNRATACHNRCCLAPGRLEDTQRMHRLCINFIGHRHHSHHQLLLTTLALSTVQAFLSKACV